MKITKLEPSKHKKGRFLVHLEDGGLLRVTEGEIVAFSLYSGAELEEETLEALTAAAGKSQLREKALHYLSARPLSRKELVDKLTARPRDREKKPAATAEEAGEVADWLEDLGLLDDAQYAKNLCQHYAAKGYGVYKLKDELYRRGVPKSLWEEALAEVETDEETIDALLRKKLTSDHPDRKELKKAADALARRGYRWGDIAGALGRLGEEIEEESL